MIKFCIVSLLSMSPAYKSGLSHFPLLSPLPCFWSVRVTCFVRSGLKSCSAFGEGESDDEGSHQSPTGKEKQGNLMMVGEVGAWYKWHHGPHLPDASQKTLYKQLELPVPVRKEEWSPRNKEETWHRRAEEKWWGCISLTTGQPPWVGMKLMPCSFGK